MITDVKLCGAGATVRQVRELFADEHVHAAVIVQDGICLGVVDRGDVQGKHPDLHVTGIGGWDDRIVEPDADLEQAWTLMLDSGRRRLAVVDADRRLRGLLCLKRTRRGFCSDADVRARVGRDAPVRV